MIHSEPYIFLFKNLSVKVICKQNGEGSRRNSLEVMCWNQLPAKRTVNGKKLKYNCV